MYCEYESDFTGPYTFVIGCHVTTLKDIPQGMVSKTVPASSYAVIQVVGEYPKRLIETWGSIWNMDLQRRYTADYEVYDKEFRQGKSSELTVCIAIG